MELIYLVISLVIFVKCHAIENAFDRVHILRDFENYHVYTHNQLSV